MIALQNPIPLYALKISRAVINCPSEAGTVMTANAAETATT